MEMHEAPFQTIPNAARLTGLSMYYLRKGCREGTVPHIMSGRIYKVDIPALLDQLRRKEVTSKATRTGIRG